MAIIRTKMHGNFAQIPNSLILDKRLSNGAKVVMVYVLGLPDGWVINNADVMNKLDIKTEDTLSGYWKQLINTGWIFRQRNKNGKGQFEQFEYILHTEVSLCTIDADMSVELNNKINDTPENAGLHPPPENYLSREKRDLSNTHIVNNNTKVHIRAEEKSVCGFDILKNDKEENKELSKLVTNAAFATWQQIAKECNVQFTEEEWDLLYGYCETKPKLPPHLIKSNIFLLDKWAKEGLDIVESILKGFGNNSFNRSFMIIAQDARGNRLSREACIKKRQEQISREMLE